MEFSPEALAKLFDGENFTIAASEMLIRELLKRTVKGEPNATVEEVEDFFSKINSISPLRFLQEHNIITIRKGEIYLHPLVGKDLNLYPHLLGILRTRFGIKLSKRDTNLGTYLRYSDDLQTQTKLLWWNLGINLNKEVFISALEQLYIIRLRSEKGKMSVEESLNIRVEDLDEQENITEKTLEALLSLEKNLHLLSTEDKELIQKVLKLSDEVAGVSESVKRELTKLSLDFFMKGMIDAENLLDLSNIDELTVVSFLLNPDNIDPHQLAKMGNDPISRLIRQFLQRDLPPLRKLAILKLIVDFFRSALIKEGWERDLQEFILSMRERQFDISKTIMKTMKRMNIWTPQFTHIIHGSSRHTIFVNDLSGSMIASYVGQVELFNSLTEATEEFRESEVVFISFSDKTIALTNHSPERAKIQILLERLVKDTGGLTNINSALSTLDTGEPDEGDKFQQPTEETIVFFISDMHHTTYGRVDPELVNRVVKRAKEFFIALPKAYDVYAAQFFIDAGAKVIKYDDPLEIPFKVLQKLQTLEF